MNHAPFIAAAFTAAGLVLGGLAVWVILERRRLIRALEGGLERALERAGR